MQYSTLLNRYSLTWTCLFKNRSRLFSYSSNHRESHCKIHKFNLPQWSAQLQFWRRQALKRPVQVPWACIWRPCPLSGRPSISKRSRNDILPPGVYDTSVDCSHLDDFLPWIQIPFLEREISLYNGI